MRFFVCSWPLVLAVAILVLASPAQAGPIDPSVAISGSVTYDDVFSFVDNASQSGSLTAIVGGTATTTSYSASSTGFATATITGANPLLGTLTDTGDGFAFGGTAGGTGANADAEFATGIDVLMNIANTSLTDVFQVTIGIAFLHVVDSTGTDAFVDSEFTLDARLSTTPPPGIEEFFTHLVTDTVNGNEVNGMPLASLGGPLSDSGTDTLVLTLNPGDTYILEGDWTLVGGAFDDATSGGFLEAFSAILTVDEVRNLSGPAVPEPGTLALVGLGLAGLVGARRRRRAP